MKIYTSYFYQLRFFKPNMIPISTAIWDPKWYHNFSNPKTVFLDKNGVVNGLRAPAFCLPDDSWQKMVNTEEDCADHCPHNAPNCAFMKGYGNYLDTLDFNDIYNRLEKLAIKAQQAFNLPEDIEIILMVHEGPTKPCAERPVIQEWFKKHGIEVKEWERKKEE